MLFLLILLIPLFTTNTGKNVVSEIDNRELAELPEIGTAGFTSDFDNYISDRIGFRNQMINSYAVLNDVVAGELTHSLYTYGQDGYIFFNMHNNVIFSDFHQAFVDMVVKLNNYCEQRGTKFYFLFDPEKISVYRRYLPVGVNYDDSWVDTLIEKLEGQGVTCINNTELLTEKSMEESVFNVEYDAGHWNDLGCFYATNALLERIHEDFPEVQPLSKEMFDISTVTATTLPVSEFRIEEEVPKFVLNSAYKNLTSNYDAEVERNANYHAFGYFINQADGAETLPKMLVFQGSYYNRNYNFLLRGASEYIAVHNYQNILNFDYYYNMFQPEMVIFDVAEYTFYDQYFSYTGMLNLDLNPGIVIQGEDSDKQIAQLLEQAEELKSKSKIAIELGNQLDQVVVESYYRDAQYAYLIVDDQVYDLSRDGDCLLSATIPHGVLKDGMEAIVYMVDSSGVATYVSIPAQVITELATYLSCTSGVKWLEDSSCVMTTDVEQNEISSVILQVMSTGEENQITELKIAYEPEDYAGAYTHTQKTGWYLLRLKANTNQADEALYQVIYLVKGYTYYYSFTLDELNAQKAVVSDLSFRGLDDTPNSLVGSLICSQETQLIQENNYQMTTQTEGNSFTGVILQLYNSQATKAYSVLASTDCLGNIQGVYTHQEASGWYTVRLRANSNLADEFVQQKVYLQQGITYRYAFSVDQLEAQSVCIRDFVLQMEDND
jgi:hypothetical protein